MSRKLICAIESKYSASRTIRTRGTLDALGFRAQRIRPVRELTARLLRFFGRDPITSRAEISELGYPYRGEAEPYPRASPSCTGAAYRSMQTESHNRWQALAKASWSPPLDLRSNRADSPRSQNPQPRRADNIWSGRSFECHSGITASLAPSIRLRKTTVSGRRGCHRTVGSVRRRFISQNSLLK
jgi:hypothetical protein